MQNPGWYFTVYNKIKRQKSNVSWPVAKKRWIKLCNIFFNMEIWVFSFFLFSTIEVHSSFILQAGNFQFP